MFASLQVLIGRPFSRFIELSELLIFFNSNSNLSLLVLLRIVIIVLILFIILTCFYTILPFNSHFVNLENSNLYFKHLVIR